jgi:hypothetical protein
LHHVRLAPVQPELGQPRGASNRDLGIGDVDLIGRGTRFVTEAESPLDSGGKCQRQGVAAPGRLLRHRICRLHALQGEQEEEKRHYLAIRITGRKRSDHPGVLLQDIHSVQLQRESGTDFTPGRLDSHRQDRQRGANNDELGSRANLWLRA